MQWETATVFISSTFQDMHGERDYLVKEVFPELLAWCERRRIHLFDVDLRWGITEEDSQSRNTVAACLHNVDSCRPFFVCFLGQRRGWVPTERDISPATLDEYPGLPHLAGRYSITEMEIEHALFAPMERMYENVLRRQDPCRRALFFFRHEGYLAGVPSELRGRYQDSTGNLDRIAEFKEVIRQGGYPVTEYDCTFEPSAAGGHLGSFTAEGESLGQVILRQLQEQIASEFPDHMELANDAGEQDDDMEFVWREEQSYYPQRTDLDALHRYLSSPQRTAFLVTGPSGSGKTSLMCALVREYQTAPRLLVRLCGISPSTSDLYTLLRSLMDECGLPCSATREELYLRLGEFLRAIAAQGPTVLLVDALNQAYEGMRLLELLPQELPEGLKIVLSCKTEALDDDILRRMESYGNTELHPLQTGFTEEFKRGMIDRFLSQYLKRLDEESIRLLVDSAGSQTPLFLSVILSELRVFGDFREIRDQITRFGASAEAAFEEALARLERESVRIGEQPLSGLVFGLLASSRRGLDEDELVAAILQVGTAAPDELRSDVRVLLRQLRPFLARRDRLYDFFHESFRMAAHQRYAAQEQHLHEVLASCFGAVVDPQADGGFACEATRPFDEYPYHLQRSGQNRRLHALLLQPRWIIRRMAVSGMPSLLRDFELASDSRSCQLVHDALRLCAPVLQVDPAQLAPQLTGRLLPWRDQHEDIARLLDELARRERRCWLEPLNAALATPGENGLQFRHGKAPIAAMCLHMDDLVVVDTLNRLGVYDRTLGMRRGLVNAGDVFVRCLASDDDILYAGRDDGTVVLWQTQILTPLRTLRLGQHALNALVVADGHLRAVDEFGALFDYDLARDVLVEQTKASADPLLALACEGPRRAYGGLDEHVTYWDGERATRFKTNCGYVGAVALLGERLTYATYYPRIFFRNLATGAVTSVDYTDGQDFASYDASTRVDHWRAQGPYLRALSATDEYVAVVTPLSVAVFSWGAQEPTETLPCHDARTLVTAGDAIYVGDGGGLVRSYRVGSAATAPVEVASSPLVSLVSDGAHLAALSEDRVDWYGCDGRAGRGVLERQGTQRPEEGPWIYTAAALWKEGIVSESLYSGYRLRQGWKGFDPQAGQGWLYWDATDAKREGYAAQFAASGDYLVMCDYEGSLSYYHVEGPLRPSVLKKHHGYPRQAIAWAGHTVTQLVTWSDGRIALLTREEPRSVHILLLVGTPHVVASIPLPHEVALMAAGPDGLLYTYGSDGSVCAWQDDGSFQRAFDAVAGAQAMVVTEGFLTLGLPSGDLASYLLPEGTLGSLVTTDAGVSSLASAGDVLFAGSESGRLMAFRQHRRTALAAGREEALEVLEEQAREEHLPARARVIAPAEDKERFGYLRMATSLAPMLGTAVALIAGQGWGAFLSAATGGLAPGSALGWLLGLGVMLGHVLIFVLFSFLYSFTASFSYEDERWRRTRFIRLLDRYGLPVLFLLMAVCCVLLTADPCGMGRLAVKLSCYLPLGFILAYFQVPDAVIPQDGFKSLIARENFLRAMRVIVFAVALLATLILPAVALLRPDLIAALPVA